MKKAMPVLAAALLVLAVTCGTVGANALLTGADVKDGSLTGADIKTGSLGTSLFSASAQNVLHGDTGLRGKRGFAGRAGTHGDAAANGINGAVGLTGPIGATGAIGSNGVAGTPGVNGAVGATGPIGATGAIGPDGVAGTPGGTGVSGVNGAVGATGPIGATGAIGSNGVAGANGIVTPLAATAGQITLATAAPLTPVISLSVPAGRYVVLAKTQLAHTGAGDSVECHLQAGTTTIDQSFIKTLPALASVAVPLQAVITVVSSPTVLTVQCKVLIAGGSADFSSLIAIPTA